MGKRKGKKKRGGHPRPVDYFRAGDMAARVHKMSTRGQIAAPAMHLPVLVLNAADWDEEGQGLQLAGYPLPNDNWWISGYFRKIPPVHLPYDAEERNAPLPRLERA